MPAPQHKEWVHFDKPRQNFAVPPGSVFPANGKEIPQNLVCHRDLFYVHLERDSETMTG